MKIDISAIIVNFNTRDLLDRCLETLLLSDPDLTLEILVVDNNSSDGSVAMVRQKYPQVQVIENNSNTGFAAANNQGLSISSGEFVFLLNPDTELFPGTLTALRELLQTHRDAGATGPRMFLDREKTLEVCSLKLLHPLRAVAAFTRLKVPPLQRTLRETWHIDARLWEAEKPVIVEGVGGAGFLIRRSLLHELGGLDEQFFMGYEDTDLAASLAQRKLKIYIHPDAHMIHLFGQAKQTADAPPDSVYAWNHAPLQFLRKHYGGSAVMLLRFAHALDRLTRLLNTPIYPAQTVRRNTDLTLTWPGNAHTEYLFEISNDLPFFDKFGARITGSRFLLPSRITGRMPAGLYHWRVYQWPMSRQTRPIYQSTVNLQKD